MVLTASLLQTSLFKHWHAKSWTFCIFIMSHLFSSCPQSFACNVKYSLTVWHIWFLDLSGVNTHSNRNTALRFSDIPNTTRSHLSIVTAPRKQAIKYSDLSHLIGHLWSFSDLKFHWKITQTESKSGVLSVQRVICYRLKAAFVHELNGWTEKVCQRAQFLIHCATVTQLLFLAN